MAPVCCCAAGVTPFCAEALVAGAARNTTAIAAPKMSAKSILNLRILFASPLQT
jgi:hypothetical protein